MEYIAETKVIHPMQDVLKMMNHIYLLQEQGTSPNQRFASTKQ